MNPDQWNVVIPKFSGIELCIAMYKQIVCMTHDYSCMYTLLVIVAASC